MVVEFDNVTFKYTGIGASQQNVLENISFALKGSHCTAIIGPSGSGKTTLVQHFTGLLKPVSGNIHIDGENIWHSSFSLPKLRKRIGIVFQFPENQLFEETVEKDVAFGPKNVGIAPESIPLVVRQAMEIVELDPDKFSQRSPFRLSEGEKRRAAIAGVLAMDSEMIILDEPTAGLDPQGVHLIEKIIKKLLSQQKSVVVITHNMDFVAQVCQRAIVLNSGRIVFDGYVRDLFSHTILQQMGLELPQFVQAITNLPASIPAEFRKCLTFEELLKTQSLYLRKSLAK